MLSDVSPLSCTVLRTVTDISTCSSHNLHSTFSALPSLVKYSFSFQQPDKASVCSYYYFSLPFYVFTLVTRFYGSFPSMKTQKRFTFFHSLEIFPMFALSLNAAFTAKDCANFLYWFHIFFLLLHHVSDFQEDPRCL